MPWPESISAYQVHHLREIKSLNAQTLLLTSSGVELQSHGVDLDPYFKIKYSKHQLSSNSLQESGNLSLGLRYEPLTPSLTESRKECSDPQRSFTLEQVSINEDWLPGSTSIFLCVCVCVCVFCSYSQIKKPSPFRKLSLRVFKLMDERHLKWAAVMRLNQKPLSFSTSKSSQQV